MFELSTKQRCENNRNMLWWIWIYLLSSSKIRKANEQIKRFIVCRLMWTICFFFLFLLHPTDAMKWKQGEMIAVRLHERFSSEWPRMQSFICYELHKFYVSFFVAQLVGSFFLSRLDVILSANERKINNNEHTKTTNAQTFRCQNQLQKQWQNSTVSLIINKMFLNHIYFRLSHAHKYTWFYREWIKR